MTLPGSFPRKTALALATAILLLAVSRLFDRAKGISPSIFADAARIKLRHAPNPVVATQPAPQPPLNDIQAPSSNAPKVAGVHEPISAFLVDDAGALDPFYAALHQLELPATSTQPQVVTILHYGDSPTTADLITGDVRQSLQARFGDAGLGFLLAAKPWAWYQHRGVDLSDHGWTISTAVGKNEEESYGIGGASFEGASGASTHIAVKGGTQSAVELAFLARPNGGSIAVQANGADLVSIPTAAEGAHPAFQRIPLPSGTNAVDLKPAAAVRLYGATLLTGHRGILYDSLGLNGASTSVLSNGFNAASWSAALRHEAPALVVINYGTNESSFGPYVDKYYEGTLRIAIARIHAALPGVPILVMSPMDRGQRTGVDQIATFDTIPRIVAIQRRVAAELHCAFFDTFDAMGGDSTMARWYTAQPRLVAGDLIHPTPQGAAIVAKLFVQNLTLGYDRYLRRLQPNYQPLPPPAPAEPAKIPEKPPVGTIGTVGTPATPVVPEPAPAEPPPSPGPPKPEPPASAEPTEPPASPAPAPPETPKAPEHDEPPPPIPPS